MKRHSLLVFGLFCYALFLFLFHQVNADLLLNEIQVRGTHNSYHLKPSIPLADAWKYSHAKFDQQFGKHHIRLIELDLHWKKLKQEFQVFHVPVVDNRSHCENLSKCLRDVSQWSRAHPNHLPIMVLLEPKFDPSGEKEGRKILKVLEEKILNHIGGDNLLTPKEVQGEFISLRKAIIEVGWPKLSTVRGKVMFILHTKNSLRDIYLSPRKGSRGRLLFVESLSIDESSAAFFIINNPIKNFETIQKRVKQGFLVRTRSDVDLKVNQDRFQAALNSGAQFISTDLIYPNQRTQFRIPSLQKDNTRCNPILILEDCQVSP